MTPDPMDPRPESKPLVSIVTPTFNSARFLEETLACIVGQTYRNIEHIVVDGGSTDGTLAILHKQAHFRWLSEPDDGMYDAINKGLRMAAGSIVAYLNSDDLYFDDTVQRVVDFFEKNREAELVYSDLLYIDENMQPLFVRKYPPFSWKMFAILDGSIVPQQTCFWRRRVLEASGYFDKSFKMAGDFEFLVRVGKVHHVRKLPGRPLAQFRFHEGMLTLNRNEINKEEIERIHKMYGFPQSPHNRILKMAAALRYKMWNLHRVKDKTMNLLSGNKMKYNP